MLKTSTILLGAGLLAAGLAAPLPAAAGSKDESLAFIVGAAVGHVVSDSYHVRHVHRSSRAHRPVVRYVPLRWGPRHKAFHHRWDRGHHRFRGHDRYDSKRSRHRHDRDDRRDRRDWRDRNGRRDGRHRG